MIIVLSCLIFVLRCYKVRKLKSRFPDVPTTGIHSAKPSRRHGHSTQTCYPSEGKGSCGLGKVAMGFKASLSKGCHFTTSDADET